MHDPSPVFAWWWLLLRLHLRPGQGESPISEGDPDLFGARTTLLYKSTTHSSGLSWVGQIQEQQQPTNRETHVWIPPLISQAGSKWLLSLECGREHNYIASKQSKQTKLPLRHPDRKREYLGQ